MDIKRPSFLGFMLNGLLLGIGIIMFAINYKTLDTNYSILIILILSIAIGVHSMLHYREEKDYGFNPLKVLLS